MQSLTQKETNFLTELKSHEQLCVDKYNKYSVAALAPELKGVFKKLAGKEQQHYDSINQILGGTVPPLPSQASQPQQPTATAVNQSEQDKKSDKYLCHDALSTEKAVSATYNTAVFEFKDTRIRDILNHIQKEEQEHGYELFNYMSVNGMYN